MLVSNFMVENATFKLAVQNDTVFVKGEQKATFNGVYCCSNTWRNCAEVDEGANVIKVVKDGFKFELFFTYTKWRNASNELPITDLVVCPSNGDHSPRYPFHFEP